MEDCLFCKIAAGTSPRRSSMRTSRWWHSTTSPRRPRCISWSSQKHIPSAAALTEEDGALLGHVFAVIAKLAREQGLDNGYRVISNVGEDAGRTVKHLHFHVLGGEKLPV